MALELQLDIVANSAQGREALRAVESDIKRVESANQRSVSWWQKEEEAIDEVTGTLTSHRGEVSKVEEATKKLETQVASAATTTAKLGGASQATTAALNGLGGGAGSVASQLLEMVGGSELSVGALMGITGAIGAVLGVAGAFLGFLAQSTKYYEEHAQAAKGLRDELGRMQTQWEGVQFVVGAAVADGANAPLVAFLRLATDWAAEFGVKIAADILLAKELANQFAGRAFSQFGNIVSATDLGDIPDPTKVLGGKHPAGSLLAWAQNGADAYTPLSGATVTRIFEEQEAERKRQLAAARRLREQEERLAKAIANLVDNGVPYSWGWPSQMPGTKVDMAAAGFNTYEPPRLDYNFGWSSTVLATLGSRTLPGTPVKLTLPKAPDSSFLSRLFGQGGITSDLGRVLEGLLVNRGSTGSALGSSIGGSIFGAIAGDKTGGLTKTLTSMLGKTVGGAIGSFLPFGGQILGSLIGSLFGPTQYQQEARQANASISDLWKQMNGQYGGNVDQALSIFGLAGNDLHGKNFQGAMGLDPLKAQFSELAKRQSEFNANLGDTLAKVQQFGGNIPEALRPYLQQLADAKTLTQDNIDLIAKLSGDAVPSYQAMEEAAKRLGVSTDHLGQAFQDAKAKANWQSVIDDLDTLIRGGADMNALLGDEGLQGKINDLVQQSIKFGTTIPSNMKPWIQSLIDSGKLLGDDHKAITDINSLHFGGDMQTTLETLNKTLADLVQTLNVKLPDAIHHVGKTWRDELSDLPTPGVGNGPSAGGGGGGADGDGGVAPGAKPAALMASVRPMVIQLNARQVWEGLIDAGRG